MATAFILVNAETGEEISVLARLKEVPEVKEAHMVYGVYDVIARVETGTMQELKDVLSLKIRRLNNISSTLTMVVI